MILAVARQGRNRSKVAGSLNEAKPPKESSATLGSKSIHRATGRGKKSLQNRAAKNWKRLPGAALGGILRDGSGKGIVASPANFMQVGIRVGEWSRADAACGFEDWWLGRHSDPELEWLR
jgi:hypothetical protein